MLILYGEVTYKINPSSKSKDSPTTEQIYEILKNGTWVNDNYYENQELDFRFTLPSDWKYAFNKNDASISLVSTFNGDALSVHFNTNTLEEQQDLEKEKILNDERYKYVYVSSVEIAGDMYTCIAGFVNGMGQDEYEHMCFMRESKNGKYVITIYSHFYGANTGSMGSILQKDGNSDYKDWLALETIKSPKVTPEELIERAEVARLVPPDLFNKYGSWEKNIYTSDYLDLRVTIIPYKVGYDISLSNDFSMFINDTPPYEEVRISILLGTPEENLELDIEGMKALSECSRITASICRI